MRKILFFTLSYLIINCIQGQQNTNQTEILKKELYVQYDRIYDFSEGLAKVWKNNKWGFINETGKEVIPCIYDNVNDFSEGLAIVYKNEKFSFIDKTGKEVIKLDYNFPSSFKGGLAKVEKNGKWGYIDKKEKEIVPLIYDGIGEFAEGLAIVRKDNNIGFVNTYGKIIIPLIYDTALLSFKEGTIWVKKDGKWGLIDKTGKEIIPFIYDKAEYFKEGLARVQKNDKWGFIDKTGKEVIKFDYEEARDFERGLAQVRKNGKWGLIDQTRKKITDFEYVNIFYYGDLLWVKKENKGGFLDKTGKIILPCIYDDTGGITDGAFIVLKDGQWISIDKTTGIENYYRGSDSKIFDSFNERAKYPGGINGLTDFIHKNIKYPKKAKKEKIEGIVMLRVMIDKHGNISNTIEVLDDIGYDCAEEAVRVIKLTSGKWKPAISGYNNVDSFLRIPIYFNLSEKK